MPLTREALTIERLRDLVQDAHLSFLLGAGASAPMFRLLGDVENLLTGVDSASTSEDVKSHARASVYASFFRTVVLKNSELLDRTPGASDLLQRYEYFLQTINRLVLERRSSLLNKQINLFTTNVDLATEVAAEALQIHLNDGFTGRLNPRFSTSNFGTVLSRRTLQYDNLSEVPTFNLLKLHGSVGWSTVHVDGNPPTISMDGALTQVQAVASELRKVESHLVDVDQATTLEVLLAGPTPESATELFGPFLEAYAQLAIVNPTKAKFKQTVLDQNYYDLLRLFSNEMEKENVVLFVMGFSCRDEHLRELLVRAARTNPTLQVIVFAYDPSSGTDIAEAFGGYPITNSNIWLVSPPVPSEGEPGLLFDLPTIVSYYFDKVVPARDPSIPAVGASDIIQETLVPRHA